jgi:hypothetical protein
VLLAGFVTAIIFMVFGFMKSSDVYKDAVAVAKANPAVQTAIGAPVEERLPITGKINTSGVSGQANLAIPISGPDGRAIIYAVATKSSGRWRFSTLVVEIKDTRQRIDLLE